jgi:hypothetical protein
MGLIDAGRLRDLAEPLLRSGYGEYLLRLLDWSKEPGPALVPYDDPIAGLDIDMRLGQPLMKVGD